uniref:Putative secreted protein n=1 Tax=Anopheles marajoara TaxID=58244 RepID=A0A2M4C8P2_9DIPT
MLRVHVHGLRLFCNKTAFLALVYFGNCFDIIHSNPLQVGGKHCLIFIVFMESTTSWSWESIVLLSFYSNDGEQILFRPVNLHDSLAGRLHLVANRLNILL